MHHFWPRYVWGDSHEYTPCHTVPAAVLPGSGVWLWRSCHDIVISSVACGSCRSRECGRRHGILRDHHGYKVYQWPDRGWCACGSSAILEPSAYRVPAVLGCNGIWDYDMPTNYGVVGCPQRFVKKRMGEDGRRHTHRRCAHWDTGGSWGCRVGDRVHLGGPYGIP